MQATLHRRMTLLNKTEFMIVRFYQKGHLTLRLGKLLFEMLRHPEFDIREVRSDSIVRLHRLLERLFADTAVEIYNLWKEIHHHRFIHEYLGGILGLGDVPEAQRDIHEVLDRYLVRDPDGTDIYTFGGLAIRSQHHKGTVRVRSRPFPGDQFRGRNPQVCSVLSKQSCVSVFLVIV